jgi:DNA-binding transcriptional ArsR family regulator
VSDAGSAAVDLTLRAMADPTRREILRLVREDEIAAGDIARHFPMISRPAVSQHLRVLTDAGLVATRPQGNRRLYRLRPEGMRDAVAFLDEMWGEGLVRLKAVAEAQERRSGRRKPAGGGAR